MKTKHQKRAEAAEHQHRYSTLTKFAKNPKLQDFNPYDAPLIAAAPELLQALKALLSTVEASNNDDDLVKSAQTAIAKAEGRTQ